MRLEYPGSVISPYFQSDSTLPGQPSGPEDPAFRKRILCEGDSWFTLGAIPSSNMLFQLKFAEPTILYNIASPGDTIINMANLSKNDELRKLIYEKNFAVSWNLIFISGGGNDLMDRADRLLRQPSSGAGTHLLDYIDQAELSRLKVDIQSSYLNIAKLRDDSSLNKEVRIVTHVYDYPTPRNAPAKFLGSTIAGPWLYRAFKLHDIPNQLWISLTDYLFEWLAGVIIDLTGKINNFYVISSTKGTLVRAKLGENGRSGDWLNEIHPTPDGYRKLSTVVSPEIYRLLYQS